MKRDSNIGFSLLEVICSLSLLGLIIVFLINIFPSSVLAARTGNEMLEAENLASSVMEESRAVAFNNLTLGTTALPSPDPQFSVTREIYVPPNSDANQTLAVRIVVRWAVKGHSKSIEREVWLSRVRS